MVYPYPSHEIIIEAQSAATENLALEAEISFLGVERPSFPVR